MTRVIIGDCRAVLPTLPADSVHCVVTSPPYFGLRDYQVTGQIGLEATIAEHVETMINVFREVRRVLRKDGTLWLNYGDSYVSAPPGNRPDQVVDADGAYKRRRSRQLGQGEDIGAIYAKANGSLPHKNLIGMPWRVAFALQEDGWWLRQDIIWSKPNPMPESVTDRCTKSHEYIFLLSKSARYYYDAEAIKEPSLTEDTNRPRGSFGANQLDARGNDAQGIGKLQRDPLACQVRNKRSVWEIATSPFSGAHFATFPPALVEPCIKAGCPKDGTVLDPFGGAGTTGLVADRLQRKSILIELNPKYAEMAQRRIYDDAPLFAEAAE